MKRRTAALAAAILVACAAAAVADAAPNRTTGYSESAKTAAPAAPTYGALASVVLPFVAVPGASEYVSFYASVSAYILSYSGTLQIRGYASYRDYDCYPSYNCDRNVMAEFTVHRGYSTYSPVVGRAYDETGQYGSSVSASFRLPACRFIERYRSITYTIEMLAVAPDGSERTATTYAYHRSCR